MAIASLIRENLKKAEEYLEEIELYEEHEDHDRPEYDIKMESLIPVLRKEIRSNKMCITFGENIIIFLIRC